MESTKRDRRIAGRISWKARNGGVFVSPRRMTPGVKSILEEMGFHISHYVPLCWFEIEQGYTEHYYVAKGETE